MLYLFFSVFSGTREDWTVIGEAFGEGETIRFPNVIQGPGTFVVVCDESRCLLNGTVATDD
jgi:hypothetical protein